MQTSATSAPDNLEPGFIAPALIWLPTVTITRVVRESVHVEWDNLDELEDVCADPPNVSKGVNSFGRCGLPCTVFPSHAACVLLNRLDGFSQREIAKHLGLSEKTVERHILRALDACRRALDENT